MSNTTSPDINKLELFVNSTVNTYKAAFDSADWEKMEQLLATQHNNHKSRKTATFPLTTVVAALLAVAVLGVIIYQLSRKGVSPDIETVAPAPAEVKTEPVVKPPVKSKLDEIVPEKDDSATESEQLISKDTSVPVKPAAEIKSNDKASAPVTTNNTPVASEKTDNKPATTTNTTTNTGQAGNNTNLNSNSATGYTKPPPSALTILYNKRKREKRQRDSVQRTIVPTKTIGSDIKQPDNLQMKPVEEPKLKGLNNMYKKGKADSM